MACLAESYIRALRSAASHRSKPYKFRRFSHWGVSSRRPTICQIIRLVSGIAHFNTIERRRSKHIIGENYAIDLPVPPVVEAKYFRCLQLAMGIVCMAMIANLLTAMLSIRITVISASGPAAHVRRSHSMHNRFSG